MQIPRARPYAMKLVAHHERTVNRAYGGSRCAGCTRQRIMRAFIIEEQKIVKKVLLEKVKSQKTTAA
jgi:large subunit ribosomal protein L34e